MDEPSAEAKTQAASAPVTAVTPEDMQTGETDPSGDAQADTGNIADNMQPDTGNAADDGQNDAGNIADDAQPAEETASGMNGSNGIYIVEKGDTLAIISKKMYGDVNHVDAICRMNGISDGNLIYIGQKLLLP